MEMDHLDKLAASTLDGYLVRKDLVRTFARQFPVPTYVVEFLLGRYCASTDQEEIEEGSPLPWWAEIDLLALIGQQVPTHDSIAEAREHRLDEIHHLQVVPVGGIALEHRELRIVGAVHALVPEILAEFEDAFEPADYEPLEVELVRDAEI